MKLLASGYAVGLAAITLVACGGSGDDTPSPSAGNAPPTPTPVDPSAVLAESGKTMEDVGAFHFRLDHRRGFTALLPSLSLDEAEGDVVKPDKISAEFVGSSAGFVVKSSLITLGDDSFMTNPLTGRWEAVPKDVSPLGFFDPRRGIASMMAAVESPVLTGTERGTYSIEGGLPAQALSPLIGTTLEGARVSVELAVRVDTHYLESAVFVGAVKDGEVENTVRTITLSRFDEPVNIEPPQ